ncbi:MAG: hypothetical protein JSW00_15890 [Thermoplasmata archaeon]|nr:MAG: hypothetical protein JSW00_15890 [Thermoplasmata archaeon]
MISRRALRIGLVIFMLLPSMMFFVVPEPAEADIITQVEIIINPPATKEVDVSPGSTGVVSFTGTVSLTNINTAIPLMVSLSASVPGAAASLSPAGMIFQGAGDTEQQFVLDVTVPLLTVRQPIKFRVDGTWNQGATSGQCIPGEGQVIVTQFQRLTIFSEMPLIETGPGTQAVFSIRVENTGNFEDEIRWEIVNLEKFSDKGWTIPLLPKTTIPRLEPKIFSLPITLPHDWTIWTDKVETVQLRVISTSSPDESVFEEYPIFIRVRGIYIPGFEPVFAVLALAFMAVIVKRRRDTKELTAFRSRK